MASLHELLSVYNCLNEPNRFSVLVYARLKVVRQTAAHVHPYVRERRKDRKYLRVHWVM